jgi:PAS domain S-box-containing protein
LDPKLSPLFANDSAQYRAILDSLDAGFCVIEMLFDEQGRGADFVFLETNASFEKTTGLADAVGMRIREFAPEHEQYWFDIYGDVALTGKPIRFEQEARALHRWYSVYAFRLGDADSRKVAVLFEDITARKKADQRRAFLSDLTEKLSYLREEEAIIRAALRDVGKFLNVDRCFFAELAQSGDSVVVSENYLGDGTPSLAGPIDLAPCGGRDFWERISQGAVAVEDVTTHPLTREHAETYVNQGIRALVLQPFRDAGHARLLLVLSEAVSRQWSPEEIKLVDDVIVRVWPVVERARSQRALILAHDALEQRIAERTAKLQAAVSELETYSYSISHDLRAPLRAMQTYAEIVLEECGERIGDDGREYLRRIISASERMDRLIRDVLVFSRTARTDNVLERVEIAPLLAAVIDTYPALRDEKNEIEVITPMAAVLANPAALTQCLANLLGNAIKFVPAGGSPKVRIWTEVIDDRVRLFVKDNGVGISEELHEKIFGVFYQGSSESSGPGTGIGLAIVRKATERMGGRVGLESAPGGGSTFWLELKRAADE